ncbi:MAG TPA: single-stranded-DNA-specific exonuclease RecJ [Burkholderiales bacterium]|nr:single-stranded-DNA-specific exonuclease RecJ [Burkholderiales bacterium]
MTHAGAIVARKVPLAAERTLAQAGVHPLLARLFAARGVRAPAELDCELGALIPPSELKNADAAAALLADHIASGKRLLIVADYDCDGATACAVGLRALAALGAQVDYFVPNRFETGYGLSPQVVDLVAPARPELIVTVDNGIASFDGIARARQLGIATLVTDHHLPADALPDAACIVNPNQPGCPFPSKAIAGVGVMFYVMLALRAELRRRGAFAARAEPNLADLLDLVALGTVADVVRLDRNNRVLVTQGLKRVRAGRMQPGIAALFGAAGRDARRARTFDLGFALGPRVNAAGRLADMRLGIEALATSDYARALNIAQDLDRLNRERQQVEESMRRDADAALADFDVGDAASLVLYDERWHQGVVGLLAGRLKDRHHRPVIALAPASDGELRGSGRSISGLHLRDALDLVSKRAPGLILRFGGHAAAAGLSLRHGDLERFRAAFDRAVREMVDPAALARTIETDGPLEPGYTSLDIARMLGDEVWGQGFPQPLFADDFAVESQRLVGERHLRLRLARADGRCDAIMFRRAEPVPPRIKAAYALGIDEWNGTEALSLRVEAVESAQ